MTVQLFYCRPDGKFFGSWIGAVGKDQNPFPEQGFIEVPLAPPTADWYWSADKQAFYLPASPDTERAWRDTALDEMVWLRDRHRDQLELGVDTTLTAKQFTELLAYMQDLRDWPQSPDFPLTEHRPVAPPWIAEQHQ